MERFRLDWNESAIAFYESIGAKVLPDWRTCRVPEDSLRANASLTQLSSTSILH
jgi:hypothetical protein